jgi:hypothetical protein
MASIRIRLDTVAALPEVGVCCGQPATLVRRQEFRFCTTLSATILVSAAMLDALAWTSRGVTLALPVCDNHRRRGRGSNRIFVRGMGLTAVVGAGAYIGAQFEGPMGNYLAVAAMFVFVLTMVVGMAEANDGLSVKGFTRDGFTLRGVHRQFAAEASRVDPHQML